MPTTRKHFFGPKLLWFWPNNWSIRLKKAEFSGVGFYHFEDGHSSQPRTLSIILFLMAKTKRAHAPHKNLSISPPTLTVCGLACTVFILVYISIKDTYQEVKELKIRLEEERTLNSRIWLYVIVILQVFRRQNAFLNSSAVTNEPFNNFLQNWSSA